MCAPFRRQRNAGGCSHNHEARILITGIIERIEPAHDERIIQCADREQSFAIDRMRKTKRRQQYKQVHFRDAQLDMLARRREIPDKGRGYFFFTEQIGHAVAGK